MLLTLLALIAPATAGAWTREWGEHYLKLGADWYLPGAYVDPTSVSSAERRFLGQQYGFYGEAGILSAWPVQVSVLLPLTVGTVTFIDPVLYGDDRGRATSVRLGDGRVALQSALLREGVQLGLGAELKVPLYGVDGIGREFGASADLFSRPGDGQIDLTPTLVFGGGLGDRPFWLEGAAGYRFRTEAFIGWETDLRFVDSLVFRGTGGWKLPPALLMLQVEGNRNLVQDEVSRQALSLGPALLVDLRPGLAIEARFSGEVWARNASQGVSTGVGLSWRRPG